ncbi:pyroglutamyl-peptidase I [Alkalihalobacillus sp. AL-G]|uniref:pyroglutamyl-peptidase I n=1 Tax=Alkalihalobacillus sp. AL-G TaxID=2926399 RepID=UPI00272A95F4|nr:pyroglutamyl-peptidase I [Alkalihalobacillus sp. AL-G]WLD93061.1 pyroglutamyl-peptidase I [Alkalihalobacillus sp. AL-G]
MKKLLLTGFEPFLDHGSNPTEYIVRTLDGRVVGSFQITGRVLPVDFERSADLLLNYVEEVQPDTVISLGLAAGRAKITPERVAINVNDGVRDNSGNKPVDAPINQNGPDAYFSTLPIRNMVNALLENGIPAEISNTAGTYLCNNVMYSMLHSAKERGTNIQAGFIHVPASFELTMQNPKIPGWPLETIQDAIELCIKTLDE